MTASLTVVHRRRLTILLPAVAVLAASSLGAGCSTVENDASARVNDTELSPDELTELVDVVGQGEVTNGDAVRSTIQTWVLVEVAGAQLEADGTELTDDELAAAETVLSDGLPGFADLSESTRDILVSAQATIEVLNGLSDAAASSSWRRQRRRLHRPTFRAVRSHSRGVAAGGGAGAGGGRRRPTEG